MNDTEKNNYIQLLNDAAQVLISHFRFEGNALSFSSQNSSKNKEALICLWKGDSIRVRCPSTRSPNQSVLLETAKKVIIDSINEHAPYQSNLGELLDVRNVAHTWINLIEKNIEELYSLLFGFDITCILQLSSQTYERSVAKGKVIFFTGSDQDLGILQNYSVLSFMSTFEFVESQLRPVRKLLEGCGDNALLFFRKQGDKCSRYVFCGYVSPDVLALVPHYFQLEGMMKWSLRSGKNTIFMCERGAIREPLTPFAKAKQELEAVCDRYGYAQSAYIQLLHALSEQSHGTSAVLLDISRSKAGARMSNLEQKKRAMQTVPLMLLTELDPNIDSYKKSIVSIAKMDGAFVVDTSNPAKPSIKYVSVIFDGDAVVTGASDRGARYNSVKNFINLIRKDDREAKVCAIICSEDGDIFILEPEDSP